MLMIRFGLLYMPRPLATQNQSLISRKEKRQIKCSSFLIESSLLPNAYLDGCSEITDSGDLCLVLRDANHTAFDKTISFVRVSGVILFFNAVPKMQHYVFRAREKHASLVLPNSSAGRSGKICVR